MNRWLGARGLVAGPLFNKIVRPHNISPKPLQKSDIIGLLNKRTTLAGLRPFSPSDVAGTHSLLTSGGWNSSSTPTIELFCLPEHSDSTEGRRILSFTPSPTLVAGDKASRLLARFLARFIPSPRAALKHNLDLLANEMSANLSDSVTFDWCSINPSRLPSGESLVLRFGKRQANAIRTTFHSLRNSRRPGVCFVIIPDGSLVVTASETYYERALSLDLAARPMTSVCRMPVETAYHRPRVSSQHKRRSAFRRAKGLAGSPWPST